MTDESKRELDRRFAIGLAWTAAGKWATQLITWASVILVARILSPADFGLVEMATVLVGITLMLAEFGMGTAAMQMTELNRHQLAQLNSISLATSVVAFALSAAVAAPTATFFEDDRITPIMVTCSVMFIFTGLQAVPLGILRKDLSFRALAFIEGMETLVQAAATAVAALAGLSYWSLVVGYLVGGATGSGLRMWKRYVGFAVPRWQEVRTAVLMGRDVSASQIANGVSSRIDGFIVGKMLGDSSLGAYRMAVTLGAAPAEKVGALIMRVTGPMFARTQHQPEVQRSYFLRFGELLALIVFPLSAGLAVTAEDVIVVLLGTKWLNAAAPMVWMAAYFGIRLYLTLCGQVLVSQRRSRQTMIYSLWSVALLTLGFVWAARFGIAAVAACWLVVAPVSIVLLTRDLFPRIGLQAVDFLKVVFRPFLSAAVMTGAVLGASLVAPDWLRNSAGLILAVKVVVGGVVYALCIQVLLGKRLWKDIQYLRELAKRPEKARVPEPPSPAMPL